MPRLKTKEQIPHISQKTPKEFLCFLGGLKTTKLADSTYLNSRMLASELSVKEDFEIKSYIGSLCNFFNYH